MEKYNIVPYIGTEKLNLKMSFDDVIKTLGNDFERKPQVVDHIIEILYFSQGIFLSFNDSILEYIGFLKNSEVCYNEYNLSSSQLSEIRFFLKNETNIIEDEYSVIFEETGLSFYFVNKGENSLPDEISLFIKGYYKE